MTNSDPPSTRADTYRSDEYWTRSGKQGFHVEHSTKKANAVLTMIRKHQLRVASIADVGCGAGEILRILADQLDGNTSFQGYDVSPAAIEECHKRGMERVRFQCCDFLETEDVVDLVLCMDVFEHIDDHIGFLRRLREKGTWHIFHIPLDVTALGAIYKTPSNTFKNTGHLHHFTKETAVQTLAYAGFEVVDCFYTYTEDSQIPLRAIKKWIRVISRKCLRIFGQDLAVRVAGGAALLVLTTSSRRSVDPPN